MRLLFVLLLLGLSGRVIAQRDEKTVILNHADSLVGREINGERARELIGNVWLTQGSIVVRCQRAVQYLTSNKVALEGEVEVLDSTMRMVGNRGMYYGDDRVAEAFERVMVEDGSMTLKARYGKYFIREKKAFFRDQVVVEDSGSVLSADSLEYFRIDQHSIASGNVVIANMSNRMTIFGDHFEDFRQRKYSIMTGHPKVLEVDTVSGGKLDTLVVRSGMMESYRDSLERLVATDSVRIIRNELTAEAGSSILYTKQDSIVLRSKPFVWYTVDRSQENQVSGDSIFIKLFKRRLETVHVCGDADAISRADSQYVKRFNQMTGQEITMRFAENKLRRIDVDRTATSLYYLFDGRTPNGVNRTSGDHVTITFSNGAIDKIKVIAGPEGKYYPERLVKNKEAGFNLPGFQWREDRPKR